MIQAGINILIIIQSYIMAYFFHLLMTPKYRGIKYFFVWGISVLQIMVTRNILFVNPVLQMSNLLISVFVWFCILRWGYEESVWKDVLAVILGNSCLIFTDAMLIFCLSFFGVKTEKHMQEVSVERLALMFEGVLIIIFVDMLVLSIAKKIMRQKASPGTLFLISQLFVFIIMSLGGHFTLVMDGNKKSLLMAMGSIVLCGNTLYCLWSVLQKSRQAELEMEVKKLESQLQKEHEYYRTIEQKREAIGKLRHDMNNQILAARHLIEAGDEKEAEELLEQLTGALQKNSMQR